jgi:hypothetical protein
MAKGTPRTPRIPAPGPREKVAGIILSKSGKTFTWTGYDGLVTVIWRKLTNPEKNGIYAALPSDPRTRLITDTDALQLAIVTKAIVSWEGFVTEDRKPCPIEPEYVGDLPQEIFNQIFNANLLGVRADAHPLPGSTLS